MKTLRFSISARLVLALVLLRLTGCATSQYRGVQSRFEQAVRADNEQTNQPFTDTAVQYAAIAGELTPVYIARLDGTLQPNAWTLRAVSEWRAGKFDSALQSANKGQTAVDQLTKKDPKFNASRDSVILIMIPGLVEDSRLRQRLKEPGPADVATHYDGIYLEKFHHALNALVEAKEKMSAATPTAVGYYWSYQCWRILENWQFVIGKLPSEQRKQARREADTFVAGRGADKGLGAGDMLNATTLSDAVERAKARIPSDHVYRKLIDLESQR